MYGYVPFRTISNLSVARVKIFHAENSLFSLAVACDGKCICYIVCVLHFVIFNAWKFLKYSRYLHTYDPGWFVPQYECTKKSSFLSNSLKNKPLNIYCTWNLSSYSI
jgi:hypothetical protein